MVNKVIDGQPHIVDEMINGRVQLVFNTTEGAASLADSASIRRTAVSRNIPYFNNALRIYCLGSGYRQPKNAGNHGLRLAICLKSTHLTRFKLQKTV